MRYSCWKCGHPLAEYAFGVQECPSCRMVNAIKQQTKAIEQSSQSSQPEQEGSSGFFWKFIFFGTIGYAIWSFFEYLFTLMWENKGWSLLGLIIVGLIIWGCVSDE